MAFYSSGPNQGANRGTRRARERAPKMHALSVLTEWLDTDRNSERHSVSTTFGYQQWSLDWYQSKRPRKVSMASAKRLSQMNGTNKGRKRCLTFQRLDLGDKLHKKSQELLDSTQTLTDDCKQDQQFLEDNTAGMELLQGRFNMLVALNGKPQEDVAASNTAFDTYRRSRDVLASMQNDEPWAKLNSAKTLAQVTAQ